ncbi:MAG TPA: helix-turn-helix domain-containing protein [Candidatus Saccharimonadales bacterium]|nr:helix-turn-helix domain-containing protein [Candidatus Saccharimonadales bacterium]
MNKAEACEFLGVSERSLARYAAQGRIGVKYVKGTRGNVAEYDDADLKRLKEELSQPVQVRGTLEPLPARSDSQALAPVSGMGSLPDLLALIAERLRPDGRPTVAVENKLTLSLAEAAALSGLSQNFLSAAIHGDKLRAAKRGRGWNIKRTDLDSFIKKL